MKHIPLLVSLSLAPVASLIAQPAGAGQELTVSGSFSGGSTLQTEGRSLGDLSLTFVDAKLSLGSTALAGGRFTYGVSGEVINFDRAVGQPLPGQVGGAGLDLGYFTRLSEKTSAFAATTLGRYGTGFNASGVALYQVKSSETFSWSVGAVFDVQGKYPALPIFGLVWQPTADITVRLGAPRAEVAYQIDSEWSASLGFGAAGGTYRTGTAGRSPSGKDLSQTWMDVRELRVGPALVWQPSPELSLRLEAGLVVDRRIEFEDRDVTLRSDDTAYGGISASFRF